MTLTSLDKDYDNLSLNLVLDFDASVEQVWELWADPRKLERWWGPPSYPATVAEHDLTPGGTMTYYMTGPEGDQHRGYWNVIAVNPPKSFEVIDGFADENGKPNAELPTTTMTVQLAEHDGGTRVEMRSAFDSREQMEQLVAMGMVEGIQQAAGQMDALLGA